MGVNELYVAVLPMVNLSERFGHTEQFLTMFPDRKFATEFFEDEVDAYISTFERRANQYLVGGHVKSYSFKKEPIGDGRVIVTVVQHVG